jgi:FAD/FMN-containing dehydrogenase
MVQGVNLRWVGRPRYVELCHDTAGVRRAVQRALDDDLRITVRSGGHCYEDFVLDNDGGAILDLSPMAGVYRDRATGWYCVEAGATLWDVYVRLFRQYGVTLPGGSCGAVGAGGHITGGGYGALSRRDGLTVDHLHAVELVHVTAGRRAEVIVARRDAADPAEREILWGHQGGGGGNFGIVTRFWFKDLPAAPAEAHTLELSWDWKDLERADLRRLVQAFGGFFAANSGVDSPYRGLDSSIGLTHRSSGGIGLGARYVGDRPELLAELGRIMTGALSRAGAPRVEIHRLPWLLATQDDSASGPSRRAKHKSAYMITPFSDGQIDVAWDFLSTDRYRNPTAILSVNGYGARVNAVDPAATAVPQRSSIMKLQYQCFWIDPAEDRENLRWIREFYGAMYGPRGPFPDGRVDGCFVNYPDVDLEDWQTLYYKDNYPRLRRVKARLDPLDVFHHRQSIELP